MIGSDCCVKNGRESSNECAPPVHSSSAHISRRENNPRVHGWMDKHSVVFRDSSLSLSLRKAF